MEKHILYIEDNMHNRRIVRKVLTKIGFKLTEAEDGLEGFNMIKEIMPPIVLLDIALPSMDGMEIARRTKEDQSLKDIHLIALTASAMHGDRERFLEAGCDDYLSKPFKVTDLIEIVERHYNQIYPDQSPPDPEAVTQEPRPEELPTQETIPGPEAAPSPITEVEPTQEPQQALEPETKPILKPQQAKKLKVKQKPQPSPSPVPHKNQTPHTTVEKTKTVEQPKTETPSIFALDQDQNEKDLPKSDTSAANKLNNKPESSSSSSDNEQKSAPTHPNQELKTSDLKENLAGFLENDFKDPPSPDS